MFYLLYFEPLDPNYNGTYWGRGSMSDILDIIRDLIFRYGKRNDIDLILDNITIYKAAYGRKLKTLPNPTSNVIEIDDLDHQDEYLEQFQDLEEPMEVHLCSKCNTIYRKKKVCRNCDTDYWMENILE